MVVNLMAANISEQHHYSYEAFVQNPMIQAVDQETVDRAPRVHSVLDIATGTGGIIDHLLARGKLADPFTVIGVDIDRNGLTIARQKFEKYNAGSFQFIGATAEALPIEDNSFELVTFCNAIHLTDPQIASQESYRVLMPGGKYLANTGYVKNFSNPQGADRFWGFLMLNARRDPRLEEFEKIPNPVNLLKYTEQDYIRFLQEAGFEDIQTYQHTVEMFIDTVKAICNYDGFAQGTLPGIPTEIATKVLTDAVEPAFERWNRNAPRGEEHTTVPRRWNIIEATKPLRDKKQSVNSKNQFPQQREIFRAI